MIFIASTGNVITMLVVQDAVRNARNAVQFNGQHRLLKEESKTERRIESICIKN